MLFCLSAYSIERRNVLPFRRSDVCQSLLLQLEISISLLVDSESIFAVSSLLIKVNKHRR